jgi:hypothetical protein
MPNLKEKVLNCFKAAAVATGATLKFEWVCNIGECCIGVWFRP